jgi:putative tryptophan/tyrosine transport system substrate-binding protein
MKRQTLKWYLMLVLSALLSASGSATAQSIPAPPSPKRIGIVAAFGCPLSPRAPDYAVRRRLAELGWIEGKNFTFDCVFPRAGGRLDQIEQVAVELVARHPDVISAQAVPVLKALKRATTTIPIVMYATPDPIRTEVVTNLARPEANVTGIAWFGWDILPKRIEILKEALPQMQRLAIIYTAQADPKVSELLETHANIAAKQLGLSIQILRPACGRTTMRCSVNYPTNISMRRISSLTRSLNKTTCT